MNKRGTGTIFCLIAAILYAARYIAAASYMAGGSTWSAELFRAGLEYVGPNLYGLSIVSLVIGIAYLVWGEVEEIKEKEKKKE